MVKLSLVPREGKFFILFEQSANNALRIAEHLKDLLHNWENVKEKAAKISELENEGDAVTHQIIQELHRTFVTPFDREDIALLAHSLDDVTDNIEAAVDSMVLYQIDRPTERAKELADIIVKETGEVAKALSEMRHKVELRHILRHCVEINRYENEGDGVYRAALGELFANEKDIAAIIKWREIYEYMENATDRGEDVANVLEGVALKYT